MSVKRAFVPSLVVIAFYGCGNRVSGSDRLLEVPPEDAVPAQDDELTCEDLPSLVQSCPGVELECPTFSQAACVVAWGPEAFLGFCDVQSGQDPCDKNGELTAAYRYWCAIQACYSGDYEACVTEGLSSCPGAPQPNPAPEPSTGPANEPTLCQQIESTAGHCPAYGYTCEGYRDSQSQCFLDLLLSQPDPCFVFTEQAVCSQGEVTAYGQADCRLQACFGLTSFAGCMSSYEILCGYVP